LLHRKYVIPNRLMSGTKLPILLKGGDSHMTEFNIIYDSLRPERACYLVLLSLLTR
jgi:hypothetical protein